MWLLVLKLVLAPVVVAAATAAQGRWGPAVGGRLVGLPLTAAPLLILLAVTDGAHFTAQVAVADQAGDVGATAWCLVYVLASRRFRPLGAFTLAGAAFAAVAFGLSHLHTTAVTATVLAAVALAVVLIRWPRPTSPAPISARPGNDLVLRMLAAAVFTFALSESAISVGAKTAGLLGALPLVTIVLTVATHYRQGPRAAERFLHGVMSGSFSVIAFLAVLAIALPGLGTVPAFVLAFAAAAAFQLGGLRRRTAPAVAEVVTPARVGRPGDRQFA